MTRYLKAHLPLLLLAVGLMVCAGLGVAPDAIAGSVSVGDAGLLTAMAVVAPFPTNPEQTGIAIAYKNKRLISDDVMPLVPVKKQEFKHKKYALQDAFTVPDTKVGRRSKTNSVEFGSSEEVDMTEDHGLQTPIPIADLNNQEEGEDIIGHSTMLLTDLVLLGREKRVADKVFGAANYGAGNKRTLAGSDRWSQEDSTPILDITEARDSMVMTPNIGVCGRKTWRHLSQHPHIVKAVNRNSGDSGIAMRRAVADLFELDDIFVGEGWLNLAKPGQNPNVVRVWGPHFALLHRNPLANTKGGVTFGYVARWGTWFAGNYFDRDEGLRGSQIVRVGESVQEVITAPDLGYLLTNAGDDA